MKLYCLCLTVFFFGFAQSQVVPHVKYTSKDGLIADRITAITQDDKGMMWFGSYFGICRYNGQTFEKIPLPPQQQQKFVSSIIPNNNSVIAGFYFQGGFIEYNKGKAVPHSIVRSGISPEISSTAKGIDGSVLIVGYNKIYRFAKGNVSLIADFSSLPTPASIINEVVEVNDSTIWAGTGNGLHILKIKNDNYKIAEKHFTDHSITNLYKDPADRIWIVTLGKKSAIYICNGKNGFTDVKPIFYTRNILPVNYESNTATSFWGIESDKGLFQLSDDGSVQYYPMVVDKSSFTSTIFCDRENNVWIANDPGVIKVTVQNTRNYFFEETAAAGGHIITLQNGSVLASNSKNMYLIKNNQIKKMPEFRSNKDAGYIASFLETAPDELWVSKWDEGAWNMFVDRNRFVHKQYFNQFQSERLTVSAFAKDNYGNIWASGAEKLYLIRDGNILQQIHTAELFKIPSQVICMTIDKKNQRLFIGGNNNGIFQVKYEVTQRKIAYKLEKHYTAKDGLTDENIRSLLYDAKGFLWAGTRYGGIFKIAVNSNPAFIKNYNSNHGLSCTRVTGIAEEPFQSVWFATCNGVHRFFYDERREHYDISTGLPSAEIFSVAIDTANNLAWALASEGVSAINYTTQPAKAPPPLINFTAIEVLGEPDTSALYASEKVKYPSGKNSISFHFSGSSFIDEKKVRYKYMLEGHDPEWSEPTANNNVTYASLPAGNYTFKVMASNAQGVWSRQPAVFRFQIVQPFYKSAWFLALLIFSFASAYYFIQNYRLRQKVKLEKLRLNIARDLHDDIGSALGSINILTKTATRKLQKTAPDEEMIGTFEKIGNSAQSTLESMDDIIWAINPEKDNWEDLLIRMKEYAIPLAEANGIQLSMNAEADDYNKLPMQFRRNIFLIFKESINNIVKHSECKNISIDSGIKNNHFYLRITDDGKGFNVNQETNRNGLKNLQQRAALVNGSIQLSSEPLRGTTVFLQCAIR